jgi:hypothetical protein
MLIEKNKGRFVDPTLSNIQTQKAGADTNKVL